LPIQAESRAGAPGERLARGTSPGSTPAEAVTRDKEGPLGAIRAFGVVLGGSGLLLLIGALSVGGLLRAVTARRRPGLSALLGSVGVVAYATVFRSWMRAWGATEEELDKSLPGDEVVPSPGVQSTRAVTITAPPSEVWKWLAQIGSDRGGFYSYAWLENLAGCRLHNAEQVHPEWQQREVGGLLPLHPATGVKVLRFEPSRALALEGGWYFALEPRDDGASTRLYARWRMAGGWAALAYRLLLELPHFIMERKMLLGIKDRAEQAQGGRK
jgi:hypothetical protein